MSDRKPQGRGRGNPTNRPPQQNQRGNQNQPPANFADSSFGPALGARGKKTKSHGAAQPTTSQPMVFQPQAPQPTTSAWGQPKPATGPPPKAGPSGAQQQSQQRQQQPQQPKQPQQSAQQPQQRPQQTLAQAQQQPQKQQSTQSAPRGTLRSDDRGDRNTEILKTRPDSCNTKRGITGRAIAVKANYFQLLPRGQWSIHHYRVDFTPEIENVRGRCAMLARHRNQLGGYLYDRGSSIYTTTQLDGDLMEITTRDERLDQEVLIKIKRVGLISPSESVYLQVLNVIMKKALHALNLTLVGRDYFDPAATIRIPDFRLQLWPGYTTSIRQHESNLLMMAEVKHKLMRDENLLDILRRCHAENRNNYQQAYVNMVVGSVVLARYDNRTYRIADVDFTMNPTNTFEKNGQQISFIDYFRGKELQIRDHGQPLLHVVPTVKDMRRGDDQRILLIPELCFATGYTDEMRRDFRLMQATAVHTRVGPADRIRKLLEFNNRLQSTPESLQCFTEWALNLNRGLVQVPARVLPNELIFLGNNQKVPTDRQTSWQNAFQGKCSMYISVELKRWIVIIPNRLQNDARQFVQCISQVSAGMRFNIAPPEIVVVQDDRPRTLVEEISKRAAQNPQLIMIAVANNAADRYSAIKKACCCQYGIPSQVVTGRVMDGRNRSKMMSVATKVAIQMNSKIGGFPWLIDIKLTNTMFVGYDVCHDTNNKSKSFGAMVATMDMTRSQEFFSAVTHHSSGEELSNNLGPNMIKALQQYKSIHQSLPDRIMFYRDGVGEGQTNYVYQHELQSLLNLLRQFYGEKPLKLAFIIVSKRVNTKFFQDGQTPTNVPAGTVVDDVVTLPERYDFFLVSQHVTQGTATPTNYNIIYDTFGLAPDKVQMITFKMCHLYYNWSGTTRVPAVCQYAHKLAFLAGQFLHQAPSARLERSLFFL